MSETTTSITSTTQRRRPNILVGVTGSVAAIKAPELAVRLVEELDANVKVLLSKGGENFWSKAADYNPIHWKRLVQLTTTAAAAATATATHAKTDEDCNGDSKDKRIQIHSELTVKPVDIPKELPRILSFLTTRQRLTLTFTFPVCVSSHILSFFFFGS